MSQSNLLKEAIADAKAVRATALANAKLALQEHFTEAVTGALSEKLKNELQDEEEFSLEAPVTETDGLAPEADIAVDPTLPVDTVSTSVPPAAAPVAPTVPPAPVNALPPVVDPTAPALQETEDPQGEKVKYTVIGNTPTLKTSAPSDPSKPQAGEKTEDPLGSKGQFKDQFTDGTVTLKEGEKTTDPLGKSGQFKDQYKGGTVALSEGEETEDEKELDSIKEELEKGAEEDEDEKEVVSENGLPAVAPATAPQAGVAPVDSEETINFDELMAEITAEAEGVAPQVAPIPQTQPAMEALQLENETLKKQLSQFNEALTFVKGKLNEVNLLNAKLLYTNKLFKAGNLSNPQKLKIVESMDLAKNTREVKLVYSTIAESINFGAKSTAPSQKVAVKTITEGLASKNVASTKPTKEVITEGTEMANRFQKLAGIKKSVL